MTKETKHSQLLKDYQAIRRVAIGCPHDTGEYYDQFADDMLERPTKGEACIHLSYLIEMYFERGGPDREDLSEDPSVREIFVRYGFMDYD